MTSRGFRAQLLDLLFPPRCQACGAFSTDPVCETCRGKIEFIHERVCPVCGTMLSVQPPENLPGALCRDCRNGRMLSGSRAAGFHAGPLRRAIIAYKFAGRTQLAPTFGEMLADVFRRETDPAHGPGLPLDLCQALLPVPLHPKRRRWRGFDQAELLCSELADRIGLPMWTDSLARIRETKPQTQLKGDSRRKNVKDAFQARKQWRLKGGSFILVDDVFTTGATLGECALVLKDAGAAAVYGLTVSRTPPSWHPAALITSDARARGETTDV